MPNFEEIWPSNKDKDAKYKRRLIGMEYYMDAMEHHGLKGHLPQPENFTTCGKLGIEINQYNCPIEVRRLLQSHFQDNSSIIFLRIYYLYDFFVSTSKKWYFQDYSAIIFLKIYDFFVNISKKWQEVWEVVLDTGFK